MTRAQRLSTVLAAPFALGLGAVGLTAVGLDILTGVALAGAGLALLGLVVARPKAWRTCAIGAAVWCVVSALLTPVALLELSSFMQRATDEISTEGARALSSRERIGVFGLNLGMGAAGWCLGQREVAVSTWALALPGPATRQRDGTFLLNDPRVRRTARALASGESRTIAWTSYFSADVSPSVSLAANCPLVLQRRGDEVFGRCDVRYPRTAKLRLGQLAGEPVYIDEGVFWVLQEAGWLHPYEVTWQLPPLDDPAYDGDEVRLRLAERLLLGM